MVQQDVVKKIKQLEIYTKRLLSGSMVGDSRSAIKGSGLEFDQIREYQLGDDIRTIDWKSTARMNKVLVKQYIEERNRTIIIAVDISASTFFASSGELRHEIINQVAGVLTLVAAYGKDQVGLILFSDTIHAYIPPAKGNKQTRSILTTLFTVKEKQAPTNINSALEVLTQLKRNDALVFLISDFIDDHAIEKKLAIVAKQYDVVAIRFLDQYEYALPSMGVIALEDPETGQHSYLDTRTYNVRTINTFIEKRRLEQNNLFAKYGVDCVDITDHHSFMGTLIRFFRRRMRY